MKFDSSDKFDLYYFLVNKLATAKIECSFEMCKKTVLEGIIYFGGDGTCLVRSKNNEY